MPRTVIVYAIRRKWESLRRFRIASSVVTDYHILRNYVALLLKQE